MAKKPEPAIHPLAMCKALDRLNGQIAMTLSAIGMAEAMMEDADADTLRKLIERISVEGKALRAATWPADDEEDA
jgi:hypothetical protein